MEAFWWCSWVLLGGPRPLFKYLVSIQYGLVIRKNSVRPCLISWWKWVSRGQETQNTGPIAQDLGRRGFGRRPSSTIPMGSLWPIWPTSSHIHFLFEVVKSVVVNLVLFQNSSECFTIHVSTTYPQILSLSMVVNAISFPNYMWNIPRSYLLVWVLHHLVVSHPHIDVHSEIPPELLSPPQCHLERLRIQWAGVLVLVVKSWIFVNGVFGEDYHNLSYQNISKYQIVELVLCVNPNAVRLLKCLSNQPHVEVTINNPLDLGHTRFHKP